MWIESQRRTPAILRSFVFIWEDVEAEELNYSQWQIQNAAELLQSPSAAAE